MSWRCFPEQVCRKISILIDAASASRMKKVSVSGVLTTDDLKPFCAAYFKYRMIFVLVCSWFKVGSLISLASTLPSFSVRLNVLPPTTTIDFSHFSTRETATSLWKTCKISWNSCFLFSTFQRNYSISLGFSGFWSTHNMFLGGTSTKFFLRLNGILVTTFSWKHKVFFCVSDSKPWGISTQMLKVNL